MFASLSRIRTKNGKMNCMAKDQKITSSQAFTGPGSPHAAAALAKLSAIGSPQRWQPPRGHGPPSIFYGCAGLRVSATPGFVEE